MLIKKGERYLCIKEILLDHNPKKVAYRKGTVYKSEIDLCITDELGNKDHAWQGDGEGNYEFSDCFQPLSEAKWAIKRTHENAEVVNRWANENIKNGHNDNVDYILSDYGVSNAVLDGYTEIDFEAFKEITGMGEEKPKQFLGEKEAVHCPTLELAEKVLEILKGLGCKPMKSAKEYWGEYGNYMTFVVNKGTTNWFQVASDKYWIKYGYNIIPAEKFIEKHQAMQDEKEIPKKIEEKPKNTVMLKLIEFVKNVRYMDGKKAQHEYTSKEILTQFNALQYPKIFTIEDVRNGDCDIINDGSVEHMRMVLAVIFPKDNGYCAGKGEFYGKSNTKENSWVSKHETDLPTQSVKLFLSQIEGDKEPEVCYDSADWMILGHKEPSEEWQPKWGEEVEARFSNGGSWIKVKYLCQSLYKTTEYWCEYMEGAASRAIEIRQVTTEIPMSEALEIIAHAKGINVNQIKIVE